MDDGRIQGKLHFIPTSFTIYDDDYRPKIRAWVELLARVKSKSPHVFFGTQLHTCIHIDLAHIKPMRIIQIKPLNLYKQNLVINSSNDSK